MRDGRKKTGGGVLVVDHVPDRAGGDGRVDGAIHADRLRAAAGKGPTHAAADAGDGEVVPEGADSGLAHGPEDGLDVANVESTLGPIEQDVVPVGGIEILDGFEFQACGLDLFAQPDQLIGSPELVRIAGNAPGLVFAAGGLVPGGVGLALFEVVHQVNDHVRASSLNRERVVFVVQHVPVETQAKFHIYSLRQFNLAARARHQCPVISDAHWQCDLHPIDWIREGFMMGPFSGKGR